MKPATTAKRDFEKTRLMIVDSHAEKKFSHQTVGDLPSILRRGDLLVVNVASTLPASFQGHVARSLAPVEIRLAAFIGESSTDLRHWSAISFGAGDWRTMTEERGDAPTLVVGDIINIGQQLMARVTSVDARAPRLIKIEFLSKNLVHDLYAEGRPIQYSYHEAPLEIWDQQTIFHGPPLSVEPPSASFPVTWNLVLKLLALGAQVAPIIHSAGISSSGDPLLDARLPLAEYFEVPTTTRQKILEIRARGGRVVALGTSTTRAVESAFALGQTSALTTLKLGPASKIRAVNMVITGMHEEGSSHAELMKAFCDCDILKTAESEANLLEYRSHEFGDLTLLNCERLELEMT